MSTSQNQRTNLTLSDIIALTPQERQEFVLLVLSRMSVKEKNEIAKQVDFSTRTPTPKTLNFLKDRMAGAVAIVAFFGFVVFVILVAVSLSATSSAMDVTKWQQYTYLLAGVETVTFTATGWLFGQEVHREQAQQAEQRADLTQQQAMEMMHNATEEAMKGRTLAKAVMNQVNSLPPNTMKEPVQLIYYFYPEMK